MTDIFNQINLWISIISISVFFFILILAGLIQILLQKLYKRTQSKNPSKILPQIITILVVILVFGFFSYNAQINKGILNQVIPGALILCIVTIKLTPVKIDENPKQKRIVFIRTIWLSFSISSNFFPVI